jgi:thiol-disulfide isomerase/thioredoxin
MCLIDSRTRRSLLLALCLTALPGLATAGWKVGDALPELGAFQLEGKLPDKLRGQVVLVDFWASWCAPCKASFPVMEALHQQYGGRGLVVLAVNVDESSAAMEKFLKKSPVSFAVVRDAAHKLVAAADVATMPTSFLVDRAGKVRFLHTGFRGAATRKEYEKEIDLLLKESAGATQP